ncbi:MAG: hypothetical protein PHV34_11790 [Verrucomicrobiae bacterium]|nr:hypothetical protein [Verrucomicrobiae bacterium]
MINSNFNFTFWNYLLLVVVSVMGVMIAYLHHPRWKAFILSSEYC